MTDGHVPPPIPPEEREPAQMLPAEFDVAESPPEGYYRPDPGEPPGQLAGWAERVLAYLIDAALVAIPVALGQLVLVLGGRRPGVGSGGAALAVLLATVAAFAVWVWNRGVRQGRTGRSVGKSTVGLVLLGQASREPIGTGRALLRDVAHILDAIPCYVGFLWPLWDAKRETFADKVVRTTVLTT
jgi:uncharacterized RDD family membrane protein YckC